MASVFTRIINRELPSRIVYEDADFIAILPKEHFVNPGRLLVIPKIEVDHIWDLPEATYQALWTLCRQLTAPLKEITGAPRIGIAGKPNPESPRRATRPW